MINYEKIAQAHLKEAYQHVEQAQAFISRCMRVQDPNVMQVLVDNTRKYLEAIQKQLEKP